MKPLLRGAWGAKLEARLFTQLSPPGILGLPRRVLQRSWAITREIIAGRLAQRAEALVYRTLLSLVPLLAISFVLLKAFDLHRQVEPLLQQWVAPLGPRGEVILETVMSLVDNTQGSLLAGFGIALLLWTALSLARRVEDSLNFIWRVSEPRTPAHRLWNNLAVTLLGPVVMSLALGLIAWLERGAAASGLADLTPVSSVAPLWAQAVPWLLVCTAFSCLYWAVPNTRVRFRAALTGGVVGGVAWAGAAVLVAQIIVTSSQTLTIYAGFAILVSALIWVFLCWLTFLIGAQVACYVQHPEYLRIVNQWPDPGARRSEELALAVMVLLARRPSGRGTPPELTDICDQLSLPGIEVTPVVQRLETAGLLTMAESGELRLKREPDEIPLRAILVAARQPAEPDVLQPGNWPREVHALLRELEDVRDGALAERTLAEFSGAGDGHPVHKD